MILCRDCKFWDRDPLDDGQSQPIKNAVCELWKGVEDPPMWTDCGENTIRTNEDFGCIAGQPVKPPVD